MILPYQSIIAEAPEGNDYILILRPEVPVGVVGPGGSDIYFGLVDTGSDNTILPKSIAVELGIELRPTSGPPANVFGGSRVRLMMGDVTLSLEANGESIRWRAAAQFFDFTSPEDETIVLGHAGFLEYFTATFDGKDGALTLLPNDDLPVIA